MMSPISLMIASIVLMTASTRATIASQTSSAGFEESMPLRSGGWNRFSMSEAGGKMMKSGFLGFSSSQVPLNNNLKNE